MNNQEHPAIAPPDGVGSAAPVPMERALGAKPLTGLFLLLLALCVWGIVLLCAQQAGDWMGSTSVWYPEGQGRSPADLVRDQRYAAEDGKEVGTIQTLWKEESAQTITDETGARIASLTVFTCFGSGDDLYPASFLYGGWPAQGDTEGIALDQSAASALWGSMGQIGQRVRWNGSSYFLRGVFEGKQGLALVQDGADSETRYPNLLFRARSDSKDAPIQTGGTQLDLPLLAWLLSALAALPGLLCMAALLLRLLRRGWKLHSYSFLFIFYMPIAIACTALALWAAGFPWEIPAKLIPTRLSDLDFWGRLAGELGSGILGQLTQGLGVRDLALFVPAFFCLVLSPLACALMLAAFRRARAVTLPMLLLGALSSMICGYALALTLGLESIRTLLALPALWLVCDFVLTAQNTFLLPRRDTGWTKHVTGRFCGEDSGEQEPAPILERRDAHEA